MKYCYFFFFFTAIFKNSIQAHGYKRLNALAYVCHFCLTLEDAVSTTSEDKEPAGTGALVQPSWEHIRIYPSRPTSGVCQGMWNGMVLRPVWGGLYPLCSKMSDLLQVSRIGNNIVSGELLIHSTLGEINRVGLSWFSKRFESTICSVFQYCVNYKFQCCQATGRFLDRKDWNLI